MIIVTTPSKPFQYTPKGTPRRSANLAEYADEISAVYTATETAAQPSRAPPPSWELADTVAYVRDVVNATLKHPIGDEEDFFQHGMDRYVVFYGTCILVFGSLMVLVACRRLQSEWLS